MGSCIICGTSVDGHICDIHEEDAVFEFEGSRADQLTPGRFYRGSVDGFADFGVFVDIGDRVTGLLHRSELDRRLESLDWESGDTVYVQVTGVHDNGNIDLAWSIRQADDEFRGTLIDSPDGDRLPDDKEDGGETGVVREGEAGNARRATEAREADVGSGVAVADPGNADSDGTSVATANTDTPSGDEPELEPTTVTETDAEASATASTSATTVSREADAESGRSEPTYERTAIDALEDRVGDAVRIESEVVDIYQTGGPTIFEIRDESGSVKCAAFEEAGVRAYPAVEIGDIVRLDGVVEKRNGDLQVETAALAVLDEKERAEIEARLDDALDARAEVEDVPLLADTTTLDAHSEGIGAVATAIRKAVFDDRPILIKHSATAEGYAAGGAIERAVLPLVRAEHERNDAAYHYVDRRPLTEEYDMNEATGDVTRMLTNRERHGEHLPLLVFADCGGTRDSRDGFDLLSIYDAPRVVIDAGADPEVTDSVGALVGTHTGVERDAEPENEGDEAELTSGTLAASVALAANEEVRDDLAHVPAVSYRASSTKVPEIFADLAADAGYDDERVRQIGEALSLIAYYQSYEDKRELVSDLLFDRPDLAEPIAARYREELSTELDTAAANAQQREIDGIDFAVLDTAAFTNGFDFPPVGVLLDELHRRRVSEADSDDPIVTVGFGEDELRYRSTHTVDDRAVAHAAREALDDESLSTRGGSDARFEFLLGEREAVSDALLDAIAAELAN